MIDITFPARFRDMRIPRRVEVRWVGAMTIPRAQEQEPVFPVCRVLRRMPDTPRSRWWYAWCITDRRGNVLIAGVEQGASAAAAAADDAARLWMQGRRPEPETEAA